MKVQLEEQLDAGNWLNLALPFTNDPVSLSVGTCFKARPVKGEKTSIPLLTQGKDASCLHLNKPSPGSLLVGSLAL